MNSLRKGLPPLPDFMKGLPIDPRGYPTPWFVATLPDGTRDFRLADGMKRMQAVQMKRCWICGGVLGAHLAFVMGPANVITRSTSEPASHRSCADFAVAACPFMVLPKAKYRSANLPEESHRPEEENLLTDNTGVSAVIITRSFEITNKTSGDWMISVGEPEAILWSREGRSATRAEAVDALDRRMSYLRKIALKDTETSKKLLERRFFDVITNWLPTK